jgi:hypothetical protein
MGLSARVAAAVEPAVALVHDVVARLGGAGVDTVFDDRRNRGGSRGEVQDRSA